MPQATMTSKGQITVPKEVRDALRLRTGDRVWFVRTDDGWLVKPRNRSIRDLKGLLADVEIPSPEQQEINAREALTTKYFSP